MVGLPFRRARLWAALLVLWLLAHAQGDEVEDDGLPPDGIEQEALSPKQMQGMHRLIDRDGNGKVSMSEFMAFSNEMRLQIAVKDIRSVLDEMDTDKDGRLSLKELLEDAEDWSGLDEEDKKSAAIRNEVESDKFKLADSNADGFLDVEEMPPLFYPETHEGVLRLTAQATLREKDRDGDGVLSLREFWDGEVAEGEEMSISEEEEGDFKKLDADKSGGLSLEELMSWESGQFHAEEAMMRLFEVADKDSDMHVTADELDAAREQIAGTDAQYHLMEWAEHHEL